MPTLPDELFSLIERLILAARDAAEEAANAAINTLAVNRPEPYPSLTEGARQLRRALRAKARQLGGGSQTEGLQPLIEEIAYQQWHRMLFARFLAENNLLMHPTGVAVSLQDCAELAPEEGEADAWTVAAKYASEMLPGIFRLDDPVVQVRFAPEGRVELERILSEIPEVVFTADDSLGWMYQFWQSKKKAEINASERKIGGADLAPVTQLFTENYMVRFLLENSLGAWWAGKHPDSPLLKVYKYMRYKDDGTPAAGIFEGWPQTVAEVTVIDPCCGSGHFLVVAFEMLRQMRMAEEGLDATEAGDAVIRDNLHGLELDLRATQIALFSVALIAWKTGGYRKLPLPNIACSGIPVQGNLERWLKLAGDDDRLKRALTQLYQLFEQAPTLGSLISPTRLGEDSPMLVSKFGEVIPVLEKLVESEKMRNNVDGWVFGASASHTAFSAKLLSSKYSLVVTNVPYLGLRGMGEILFDFCTSIYPTAKQNLATVFLERCLEFTEPRGSIFLVIIQGLLYKPSFTDFRKKIIKENSFGFVTILGIGSFRTISGAVVEAILFSIKEKRSPGDNMFPLIDVSRRKEVPEKSTSLVNEPLNFIFQKDLLKVPAFRVGNLAGDSKMLYLKDFANAPQGIKTGDDPKWIRFIWELDEITIKNWKYCQGTTSSFSEFSGRERVIDWRTNGNGMIRPRHGSVAFGKLGVAVSQTGAKNATIYTGEKFDSGVAPIVPENQDFVQALWAFCSSEEYQRELGKISPGFHVTNSILLDIPFDLNFWMDKASNKYPNGLPEPYSNDPTQWVFKGCPVESTKALQVAVIRLLDYHWPEQEKDDLDDFVDDDGIVPLIPAGREEPAADRLRALLAAAYRGEWSPEKQRQLLASVDFSGKSLEEWLRDGFFKQHVKLFKNRPFIWHIWDGRKDGFHALVNYHKLDAVALDKLIYTYLGSWIEIQRGHRNHGEPGADGRLVAALELQEKLEAIREGEPPYDIYVRWKSLVEQPIGWNPDLNDGVRLNIRPFVTAGVLRSKFTIHWKKDRGKNPDGSVRLNTLEKPFTNVQKRAAR